VSSDREHYALESSPERYSHKFHAGNIGDVWKHIILTALIQDRVAGGAFTFFETHAGSGAYQLGATGEWTEGLGALLSKCTALRSVALRSYIARVQEFGFRAEGKFIYPGSPVLAASLMRPIDALKLWELDPSACAELRASTAQSLAMTIVEQGDGMRALEAFVDGASGGRAVLAHIDPPWSEKRDWQLIPREILAISRMAPQVQIALWYPIKSYTRVNAMLNFLKAQKLEFVTADLITSPLENKRNRLNGSGMLLVGTNNTVLTDIAAAGVEVGMACGLGGFWDLRMVKSGE